MYNYRAMTRPELIRHVTAYGEALHTLGNRAVIQELELRRLRMTAERMKGIDGIRQHIHGGKSWAI